MTCLSQSRWIAFLMVSKVKLEVWDGLERTWKAKTPTHWSVKLCGPLRKKEIKYNI